MSKTTKIISSLLLVVILLPIIGYTVVRFGLSKDNISYPAKDHSHFRIKYVFNGQEEDFGSPRYQTDYTKDVCDGTLTESPLHFHDNKPDYQHTHWTRLTGGQFLKFYGINKIGGLDDTMGFKLDQLPKVTTVPIYGKHLPEPRNNDKFWAYTGVEKSNNSGIWETKQRSIDDFVNQDFETFFGVESQVRKDIEKYGTLNLDFFRSVRATAHSGVEHSTPTEEQKHFLELAEKANTEKLNNQLITQNNSSPISSSLSQSQSSTTQQSSSNNTISEKDPVSGEELKSINNFLGDVVIFVQPDAPTAEQVQARFATMVKLDKSVCGG
jgi:hypothetical protein